MQAEIVLEGWGHVGEHVDISAGREEFLTVTRDHDHLHGFIQACLEYGAIERLHHLVGIGVRGRIVQRQKCNPIPGAILNQICGRFHFLNLCLSHFKSLRDNRNATYPVDRRALFSDYYKPCGPFHRSNVTEPGAVATGCYAQLTKEPLERTLSAGIQSLPLPVL